MGKDTTPRITGAYGKPAIGLGGGIMLAAGAEIFGGAHWLTMTIFLVGVVIFFVSLVWVGAEWFVALRYRRIIASLEVGHEITQLRNDAKQLIDVFSDFGSPKDQRDNVYERVDRIKNSDHSVWLDNENLCLARKDFVHWCGVAQAWREQYGPTFRNTDDRDQTLHYLKDAANRLAAGWMGNLVRNQQPYDRSGGE